MLAIYMSDPKLQAIILRQKMVTCCDGSHNLDRLHHREPKQELRLKGVS